MPHIKELHVNGSVRPVDAEAERSLLSVLRDDLDLTGTKYGCGEAECGACVVLLDGRPVPSCVTSVGDTHGKQITTIEGLEKDGRLHPVQEAFIEAGAMQCGYCIPGMIMASVALLNGNPRPDDAAIKRAMNNHVCRCGTYTRITAAFRAASVKSSTSAKGGGS